MRNATKPDPRQPERVTPEQHPAGDALEMLREDRAELATRLADAATLVEGFAPKSNRYYAAKVRELRAFAARARTSEKDPFAALEAERREYNEMLDLARSAGIEDGRRQQKDDSQHALTLSATIAKENLYIGLHTERERIRAFIEQAYIHPDSRNALLALLDGGRDDG